MEERTALMGSSVLMAVLGLWILFDVLIGCPQRFIGFQKMLWFIDSVLLCGMGIIAFIILMRKGEMI